MKTVMFGLKGGSDTLSRLQSRSLCQFSSHVVIPHVCAQTPTLSPLAGRERERERGRNGEFDTLMVTVGLHAVVLHSAVGPRIMLILHG